MKKIAVNISRGKSYQILIGEGIVVGKGLAAALRGRGSSCLVVTDRNVAGLYKKLLPPKMKTLALPPGEEEKKFSNIERICREAVESGLDRGSQVVALGGGVVGDMAGFAASIYMRGVDYVQVPTTVLAMVDSSVGGKTGVDLPEGKNLVGTFWQPAAVFADTSFIRTLPAREIRCGLAEIIKYGVILDPRLFSSLEKDMKSLLACDLPVYEKIIARCCQLKADVVEKDEKEGGLRAILNYGHTFGHAVEKVSGFGRLSHGEAVAVGMRMAAKFAVASGMLDPDEESRQNGLLDTAGLPKSVKASAEKIYSAMFSDKKARAGRLRIVVPRAIGRVELLDSPDAGRVLSAIKAYCSP